ncbi:MAG: quinone-dependent dihydroorotate dehydrogenase [bacterium]|nr:quinone-dependent dihydroorotate dehydrogenase [bacterium]
MPIYKLLRPILFSLDPEVAHELVMSLSFLTKNKLVHQALSGFFRFEDPRLETELFGLRFKNPIGLAAGIDKNCRAIELLSSFGSGAIEVGVVSAKPQEGNDKPRVFRFPNDFALINRMGNPNIGADAAVINLAKSKLKSFEIPPIGLNIGKTTATPIEEATEDYVYTLKKLYDFIDYFIINVSCPNVAQYSKLQERETLNKLLAGLQAANTLRKPILVKLSPDLNEVQIEEALGCCLENSISGIIATNTTLTRKGITSKAPDTGGMSGKPLFEISLNKIKFIFSILKGKLPIVGVGGVASADNVISMMQAGANIVELYTALIYQGPGLIKRIKMDLVKQMERDGVKNISQYIGNS